MKHLLLSALALSLLFITPTSAATVVGGFDGISEGVDYEDIWKVDNASPQALILDDITGDDELRTLSVGDVTEAGCELDIQNLSDSSSPSLEFVNVGTIVILGNVYIGVSEIDLTPLKCLVAYNFTSLGDVADITVEPDELDEALEDAVDEEPAELESTCSETDGGFAGYAVGTMTHTFPTLSSPITDTCTSDTTLDEYYCNDQLYDGSHIASVDCEFGCSEGRCLYDYEVEVEQNTTDSQDEEDLDPEPVFFSCTDSDLGYAPHDIGFLTLTNADGDETTVLDECLNSETLYEFYCDERQANQFGYSIIDCPGGCGGGECVVAYCNETDDGYDPFTGGTMNSQYATVPTEAVDVCTTTNKLVEYACEYQIDDEYPTNDYHGDEWCTFGCVTDDEGQGHCMTFLESLGPTSIIQQVSSVLVWILGLFGG